MFNFKETLEPLTQQIKQFTLAQQQTNQLLLEIKGLNSQILNQLKKQ